VYQREGILDSAALVFASLLERIPSAEAHRQLGLVYLQQGALEQATKTLREAERWWPYDPQVLVGLGRAMARRGAADSARVLLASAERLRQEEEELRPLHAAATRYPGHPQPHFNLGVAYSRMGRIELAKKEYWRAVEVDPAYGLAYQGLGNLALVAGDMDGAEGLFRAAVARDSTLATAHSNLGLIYHSTDRLAMAIERFEAAIRHAPEDVRLWANAARAYLEQGQVAPARRAASRALAEDPLLSGVREILGDVCSLEGELEQALKHWRRVAEETGGDSGLADKIERAERALAAPRP
jgi:tetratricopeptide (TPR) repeat protein